MPALPSQPWPAASRQLWARGPQANVARAWSTATASSGTSTSARNDGGMRAIATASHQRELKRGSSAIGDPLASDRMAEEIARVGELEICYETFGHPKDP